MAIPLLGKYRERKQAELDAAVEKALSPMLSQVAAQSQGSSGATYPFAQGRDVANPYGPSSPFTQTGGFGGTYAPLPREDDTFNSLFGPGYPLIPFPLDPVRPDGRVQPRRGQYEVSTNLNLLDREVPWAHLRWMARHCDIISRCIELVQDGLVGKEWSWGFSDDILQQIMTESGETNHARAMAIAKDKYGSELDRVKQFFKKPDPRSNHIFSQWMSEMIWQSLVYDGVVIYPQFTLGGDLYSLSPIDTSTIKILLDNQGFPPEPPAPAYQQILYGFPRGEFQAQDGPEVEGEYQRDQLAYYIRRPRPESVYGFSPVEESLYIAQTYLERQQWMRAEYTNGATPKTYFKMAENSNWTPEQTVWFEQQLNDRMAGQNLRRQMAMLLPNGIEPEQMKQLEETYKQDYDNFYITQIGSKFGVPATQLGVQAKAGLSGGKQMEGESGQTEQFVFSALIQFFVDILNDLAYRYLGVGPEITATCNDPGDNVQDILNQANADTQEVNNGRLTLNDWRASKGLPLYDMPEADEPFIAGAQGPVFLKGTLAVQDANTENTLNPPEPTPQLTTGQNNGGTDGSSNYDTNGGLQSVSSGTGSSQNKPNGSSTPSKSSGTSDKSDKLDSDGNTDDGITAGESDATKELTAFTKFAKVRISKSNWRDFEFLHIDSLRARQLNLAGRSADFDFIKDAGQLHAAGLVVKADDTGRVLMVQRSIDNHNEQAAGLWEWPGGCIDEPTDTAWETAQREWTEEVGVPLPKGKVIGSWTTPDGRYTAFVYVIKHEASIDLSETRNAFDGTGDGEIENVAWWNVNDLQNNAATRAEIQSADWSLLATAKKSLAKKKNQDDEAVIDYSGRVILPQPLQPGDKVVIEHKHGKDNDYDLEDVDDLEKILFPKDSARKAGRPQWADHPNHVLRDKIVAHYAPQLVQAFKDATTGIDAAITEAQRKAADRKNSTAKSLAKAGEDDAQNAINAHVRIQDSQPLDTLRQMLADSYLAGSHSAVQQIGGGAKVLQSLETAATGLDWNNWKAGWLNAAGNVKDGGLADLLSQADATIQGIQGTALTRLGNVLSDGIASGDSVQSIASAMSDMIMSSARAMVIANTETARSMVSATLSTYDQNGVDSWEWLAEDDACPECDDLDGESFDTTDSSQDPPPLHPSCRCATLPNVSGQDVTQPTLDDGGDDELDSADNATDDTLTGPDE